MPNTLKFRIFRPDVLLAIALLCAPGLTHAADTQDACTQYLPGVGDIIHRPALYNFRLENDLFRGTDSDYTSGVSLSWVSANLKDYMDDPCLPHWVRQLNKYYERMHPNAGSARNMVVTAGQMMYTPHDRQANALIQNDRPYAGWLYLGLGYNSRTDKRMDSAEVNVGIVGPAALARQSQNFIHDLRSIPRFNGLNNQLKNELGIQIVAERKKRFWEYKQGGEGFDAILHYGTSLGNVKTHLNAGLTLRIGRLPDDFGTSPIRPGGEGSAPLESHLTHRFTQGGLHAFLSTDARLVGRDIFLDGNTFGPSHRVEKKRIVGDIATGFAWQWPGGKLSYAHYARSREFYGQGAAPGYGSVTLSLEY